MNDLEAARMKVKCLEIVEHSTMAWWLVVRNATDKKVFPNPITFCGSATAYEIAIGITEGKPVWHDSELYSPLGIKVIARNLMGSINFSSYSWNPPKTSTFTIELEADDVEYWAKLHHQIEMNGFFSSYADHSLRFYAACQKAWETRK